MNFRKLLPLLLVLILTLSLFSGCADTAPAAGAIIPQDMEEITETDTEDTADKEELPAQTEAPAEEEAPEEDKNPITLGRIEGGVYSNSYAGIACELDSNWSFFTAEELQQLPEDVHEMLSGTDVGELIDDYPQITDMFAENATDLTTINVLYTKIPVQEQLYYLTQTEEALFESLLAQEETLKEAYAAGGMELVDMEVVSVTFLGEEHYALKSTLITQGVDYYILQVANYKLGSYGVTLTVSSYLRDNTQNLLSLFYPVD